jgi:cob(I)alamin adenosyltransferase
MTAELPELKSFIMPGGNARIAQAHVCRVVCRRAERRVVTMSNNDKELPPFLQIYLNRLSDYFFIVARYLAHIDRIDEVKWNASQ